MPIRRPGRRCNADAAIAHKADNIIRITADCPLIDPGVVDQVIIKLMSDPFLDYACNFFPERRFPRGLDAEAFTLETLLQANKMAVDPPEREHVTLQIYRNPSLYMIGSVQPSEDHSSLRWTVDTMDDLRLINSIYRHFGSGRFRWRNIVDAYRENPHWLTINQNGHLTRMIALSSACRSSGADVTFISNEMPATLQKTINETGCRHQRIDLPTGSREDRDFTADYISKGSFDWTILDGYLFDDAYQKRVGQPSTRLMVVDDYGHATHQHAHLILNQNAYADRSRYSQLESTDVLCGLKHTLLRPEFHSVPLEKPGRKNARFSIRRILVTFGGSDLNDWTQAVLRTLLELKLATDSRTVADVVIGADVL